MIHSNDPYYHIHFLLTVNRGLILAGVDAGALPANFDPQSDVLQIIMNSIKQQISVIVGLLCIAGALGCHAIKASASGKENPYAKVIMPTTEMTNVTFLEAIDRLVAIHRDLRQKHMESHDDHKWCGGFPGLHFIVRPLSNEANNRRWSFRFENASMAEAFEAVACKFGLKLSYEEGAFADGYAIFEDPNYDTEPMPALGPSDDPFAGPEK